MTVDGAGHVAGWNRAAERLYGYGAAEVVGRPLEILYFPTENADLASLAQAPAAAGPREWIRRQRHKSGRELWVALRLVRFEVPGDEPGFLLCAVDVTRTQRAEEDRARSRAALAASRAELRKVTARLVAGDERDRRRVARELHDDFGQRLSALAFGVKAVRKKLPVGDPWARELDAVGGSLAELAEDLRRLIHDLHPAALDRRGLAEALRDHCTEVERRFGLPVRLSWHGAELPFPPEVDLGLYRIVQEALANTVRHARARTAHVSLEIAAGAAHLTVADDGTGFDHDTARGAGGLGLASIEERARLLGGRCRFASGEGTGTVVEVTVPLPSPEPAGPEPAAADDPPSQRHVGPYRLLEEIGTGSMATVYLAEEPAPLGRRVALKLHRDPLPGRLETLRFKAEQQALARLHHPAVAEVHEARTTEEGDLYIAMEYVPGLPITDYCDRYCLDLPRRLALFAAVCDGVRHAHQKGVLHRDLKPSNILVMEEGGAARPKVIGFGAAKGLDSPLAEGTVWTAELGTPVYLDPEALDGGEVDTRSDVYALGVVLYELLVGTVPFEAAERGIAALVQAVLIGEVPPPSRRLKTMEAGATAEVARRRGLDDATQLGRRLAGDLDRIAGKALARDPAARYPTVDALGEEVRRVLRGEPAEAGPPGALHQLVRLVRRHRRLVASVGLVILALAGGLVTTVLQARRAEREAQRADAVARFLEELFRASDPRQARGEPPGARELLRRGTERLATELRDQPLARARLLDTLGGIHTELGLYDEARPLLEEALALREGRRGGEHPEVAATVVRLGSLAHLSGQGDAVALFRRALAIREARADREPAALADLLNKLGVALSSQRRFGEAETVLRRSLTLQERLYGPADRRVAKVLHNLSGIAYYREEPEVAEELIVRALAIREAVLAEDDPELAGSREALALLRRQQGRPAEAAELLERLVATAERVYGPDHPELARTLLNLGLARDDLGAGEAARAHFERALAIFEKALAPEHPRLVRALATLAEHHVGQGRTDEAEPLYRRLLALHERKVAFEGWDRVIAQWEQLLEARGPREEALSDSPTPAPGGGR